MSEIPFSEYGFTTNNPPILKKEGVQRKLC
jgi:hypothetical protein